LMAAAVAMGLAQIGQQRGIIIVHAARHHAPAIAQRARHAELGDNGLANKIAFILELVEQAGELAFYLERDDGGLGAFARHEQLSLIAVPVLRYDERTTTSV